MKLFAFHYQVNSHKCMGTSPEQAKRCSDLVTMLDGDAIAFVSNPTLKAHLHQANSIPCNVCIHDKLGFSKFF